MTEAQGRDVVISLKEMYINIRPLYIWTHVSFPAVYWRLEREREENSVRAF